VHKTPFQAEHAHQTAVVLNPISPLFIWSFDLGQRYSLALVPESITKFIFSENFPLGHDKISKFGFGS
jgi:hypothetical protein